VLAPGNPVAAPDPYFVNQHPQARSQQVGNKFDDPPGPIAFFAGIRSLKTGSASSSYGPPVATRMLASGHRAGRCRGMRRHQGVPPGAAHGRLATPVARTARADGQSVGLTSVPRSFS
jgi:hypothetical protein